MWESYDWGNEDLLWASTAFNGGIGGQQQAPCGVISSSTVVLGLSHRQPLSKKKKAEQARGAARRDASDLVKGFAKKFGAISCWDLLGVDLSQPEERQRFLDSGGRKEKCDRYIQFAIEKLYKLDKRPSSPKG